MCCPGAKRPPASACRIIAVIAPNDLDRTAFLGRPDFWAMYYYTLLRTEDRESGEWVEPLFGVSDEQVSELYTSHFRVVDDPPWPNVYLPMPDGFGISVEFADDGDHYRLHHRGQNAPLRLGQTGAAEELPAFRWREIEQIAKTLAVTATSELHRKAGLLLLFPAAGLTGEDDRAAVSQALVAAWERLGVARKGRIGTLVDLCMDSVSCLVDWRNDPQLGWVNDDSYSRRNPLLAVKPYSRQEFALIRTFFRAAGVE